MARGAVEGDFEEPFYLSIFFHFCQVEMSYLPPQALTKKGLIDTLLALNFHYSLLRLSVFGGRLSSEQGLFHPTPENRLPKTARHRNYVNHPFVPHW